MTLDDVVVRGIEESECQTGLSKALGNPSKYVWSLEDLFPRLKKALARPNDLPERAGALEAFSVPGDVDPYPESSADGDGNDVAKEMLGARQLGTPRDCEESKKCSVVGTRILSYVCSIAVMSIEHIMLLLFRSRDTLSARAAVICLSALCLSCSSCRALILSIEGTRMLSMMIEVSSRGLRSSFGGWYNGQSVSRKSGSSIMDNPQAW